MLWDSISGDRHNKGGSWGKAGKIKEVSVVRTGSRTVAVCGGHLRAGSCRSSDGVCVWERAGTVHKWGLSLLCVHLRHLVRPAIIRFFRKQATNIPKTKTRNHTHTLFTLATQFQTRISALHSWNAPQLLARNDVINPFYYQHVFVAFLCAWTYVCVYLSRYALWLLTYSALVHHTAKSQWTLQLIMELRCFSHTHC